MEKKACVFCQEETDRRLPVGNGESVPYCINCFLAIDAISLREVSRVVDNLTNLLVNNWHELEEYLVITSDSEYYSAKFTPEQGSSVQYIATYKPHIESLLRRALENRSWHVLYQNRH